MTARSFLIALTMLGGNTAAHAQGAAVQPTPDLSIYAKSADVAAMQSQIPPVCPTPPANQALAATAGTLPGCTPRGDAAAQTPVQAANTTLNADCTWSIMFLRNFLSSVPVIHAEAVLPAGATQPIQCSPISRSINLESGRCFAGQTLSLTLAGVTAGLNVNANGGSCTAGTPIMVWGREPTQ